MTGSVQVTGAHTYTGASREVNALYVERGDLANARVNAESDAQRVADFLRANLRSDTMRHLRAILAAEFIIDPDRA